MAPAGTDLVSQGEAVPETFTVIDGWGLEYKLLDNGRRQITRILLPGDFVGFQSESDVLSEVSVRALTDVTVCVLPREALDTLLSQQAELTIRLTQMIAQDRARIQGWLTNIGQRSGTERVANFLLEIYLRIRMRSDTPLGWEIALPLTQGDIGDVLGVTAVHLNRLLRDLRQKGLAVISDHKMKILDPDGLVEVAGLDEDEIDQLLR